MRNIKKISKQELLQILRKIDGSRSTFISILTNTDARLLKRNNPFLGTRKISKVFGLLNFNYENSRNNKLKKFGLPPIFKAKSRKYGMKNDSFNGCLLEGANDEKLIISITNTLKPKYLNEGKLIGKDKIQQFFPKRNKVETKEKTKDELVLMLQNEYPDLDIEKISSLNIEQIKVLLDEYIYRNYDISNIKKITLDKVTYKIVS